MKKNKINSKVVMYAVSAVIIGASCILLNTNKPTLEMDNTSSKSNDLQVGLNYKNVKFKNNGDSFELIAIVNEDATIKSVKFTCDHEDYVSLTRISQNSVRITRLKQFQGLVTITATSDDVYSNFKENCYVRCYNNITSLDDTYSSFVGEKSYLFPDVDTIYMSEKFVTKVNMNVSTNFGTSDNVYNDGTFPNIEENDLSQIKNNLTKLFSPLTINNFSQNDNSNCSENIITFELFYNSSIFNTSNEVIKKFTFETFSLDLILKKYIPVNGIEFSQDGIIVI